jgi:hypothetical protein
MLPLFLVAVTLVLFAGMPLMAQDKDKGATHEGTVVSVSANKIVMKGKDDATEHTHTLAADAKITCDDRACKLDELKPGQKVRVTTKKGDKTIATKIEALDKNKEFSKL